MEHGRFILIKMSQFTTKHLILGLVIEVLLLLLYYSYAHTHYGDLPYIIKMIRPAIVFIGWVIMLAIFDHYQLSRFKWLSIGLIVVVTFIFSAMIFYTMMELLWLIKILLNSKKGYWTFLLFTLNSSINIILSTLQLLLTYVLPSIENYPKVGICDLNQLT